MRRLILAALFTGASALSGSPALSAGPTARPAAAPVGHARSGAAAGGWRSPLGAPLARSASGSRVARRSAGSSRSGAAGFVAPAFQHYFSVHGDRYWTAARHLGEPAPAFAAGGREGDREQGGGRHGGDHDRRHHGWRGRWAVYPVGGWGFYGYPYGGYAPSYAEAYSELPGAEEADIGPYFGDGGYYSAPPDAYGEDSDAYPAGAAYGGPVD